MKPRGSILKLAGFLLASFSIVIVFQNCGKGFQSSNNGSSTVLPVLPEENADLNNAECIPNNSSLLSQTCFSNLTAGSFDNFKTYTPQYPLYSDGATKIRWVYLPEGTQINTNDPDNWVYPQGTILWKEFSLENKRIETRRLVKTGSGEGPGSWSTSVFLWLEDGTDAEEWTTGMNPPADMRFAINNLTQTYSAASPNSCNSCHAGARDYALGFTYLQLSVANGSTDAFAMNSLAQANLLTTAPAQMDRIAGMNNEQRVFGYLHGNCAHCHNPMGAAWTDSTTIPDLNLKHSSGTTDLTEENGYITTVGVTGFNSMVRIDQGVVETNSSIYTRMQNGQMPSRGVSIPDAAAISEIGNWISSF